MHTAVLESRSTTAKPVAKRSAPLDPQVADRLLDLLSSNDKFRALFVSSPREALSQVGFVSETDLASPHFCFGAISKLASRAEIAAARNEIRTMLTHGLALTTPQLDTGLRGRYVSR